MRDEAKGEFLFKDDPQDEESKQKVISEVQRVIIRKFEKFQN